MTLIDCHPAKATACPPGHRLDFGGHRRVSVARADLRASSNRGLRYSAVNPNKRLGCAGQRGGEADRLGGEEQSEVLVGSHPVDGEQHAVDDVPVERRFAVDLGGEPSEEPPGLAQQDPEHRILAVGESPQ